MKACTLSQPQHNNYYLKSPQITPTVRHNISQLTSGAEVDQGTLEKAVLAAQRREPLVSGRRLPRGQVGDAAGKVLQLREARL